MSTSRVVSGETTTEAALVDGLVQLSFLVQGVLGDAGAEVGLTVVQMRLLGALRGRKPAMSELAAHFGLDKSSVTGLVDRAERRGLVTRVASTHDGRSVCVSLTRAGRRLADRMTGQVGDRLGALVDDLTAAESAQLAALAERLIGSGRRTATRAAD